jgi:pimeloyl-ACP methyl ester carboxylesterase
VGTFLIFADHRGQGRSDKPTDVSAYALPTRVADVIAVLDALDINRAHFVGSSWGARLGYALGEHAPERLLSLVLCGNQPYVWNLSSPTADAVAAAIAACECCASGHYTQNTSRNSPGAYHTGDAHGSPRSSAVASTM